MDVPLAAWKANGGSIPGVMELAASTLVNATTAFGSLDDTTHLQLLVSVKGRWRPATV